MWRQIKKVPLIVWPVVFMALVIGFGKLVLPEGDRVVIVGAGVVHAVSEDSAPDGTYYDLEVRRHESIAETRHRVEEGLRGWKPRVLVIAFDASALAGGESVERSAREAMTAVSREAENRVIVPIIVGFVATPDDTPAVHGAAERLNRWWREELCTQPGFRLCLDLEPHANDPAAVERAMSVATSDAAARHAEWRVSTQVGR